MLFLQGEEKMQEEELGKGVEEEEEEEVEEVGIQ